MGEPSRVSHDDDLPELIQRARRGDAHALDALLGRVREPLLRRVRWMMGPEARQLADSDDFLQSTFAAALPALERFEDRTSGSFLRWLTTIARNKIRSQVRRQREVALSTLSSSLGAAPGTSQDGGLPVDQALALFEAFATLSEGEQRVIELRDLEGRSFEDVGHELGCGERQAQRRHAGALLRLGRRLRGGDGPG